MAILDEAELREHSRQSTLPPAAICLVAPRAAPSELTVSVTAHAPALTRDSALEALGG